MTQKIKGKETGREKTTKTTTILARLTGKGREIKKRQKVEDVCMSVSVCIHIQQYVDNKLLWYKSAVFLGGGGGRGQDIL